MIKLFRVTPLVTKSTLPNKMDFFLKPLESSKQNNILADSLKKYLKFKEIFGGYKRKMDFFSTESTSGHYVPRIAKKKLDLVDTETGYLMTRTDLEIQKWKRNRRLDLVIQRYENQFKIKEISVLNVVIFISTYPKFSEALKLIQKWLLKYQIKVLCYCWVRDIGNTEFKTHFQCVIVTSRFKVGEFRKTFSSKSNNAIRVVPAKSLEKSVNYLKSKEIYGEYKQKSYSVTFKKRNH